MWRTLLLTVGVGGSAWNDVAVNGPQLAHRAKSIGGVLCIVVGVGVTAILAFAASSTDPPDGAQSALLVLIAGLFQIAGTALFASGRPSRVTTKTSIRHVGKALRNIVEAKAIAEAAIDNGTAKVTKAAVGELSFRLEAIEQQLTTDLEDWAIGHPTLINEDFLKEIE
jgi:hypothetical protein